tara:strand:+ start:2646 stop:2999 length:354 start_codon:yes stop_codon:yes gene_type:complete
MQLGIDDFALLIYCGEDKEGKWDGHVDIKMHYSLNNKYDQETNNMIINMMSLMSTCVTMMETDKDFLRKVYNERKKLDEEKVHSELDKHDELESKVKLSPKIVSKEGNVIKIDWRQV